MSARPKLAAGIAGQGGPELLATYDVERRPVAGWVTQQAFENLKSVGRSEAIDGGAPQVRLGRPEFFRERGMVFGAAYQSSAVVPDGTLMQAVDNPLTSISPARGPVAERRTSGSTWRGAGPRLWTSSAPGHPPGRWSRDAPEGGPEFRHRSVVGDRRRMRRPRAGTAYGLEPVGAVLVRPDGYVGWRSAATPTAGAVVAALESILDHNAWPEASRVGSLTTAP